MKPKNRTISKAVGRLNNRANKALTLLLQGGGLHKRDRSLLTPTEGLTRFDTMRTPKPFRELHELNLEVPRRNIVNYQTLAKRRTEF